MIRLIESTNRAEVEALLSPGGVRDRATEQAAARIVARVRAEGDAALRRYARTLDGWSGPIEVSRRQIDAGARKAPRAVRAALTRAARAHSRGGRGAAAARVAGDAGAGRHRRRSA